MEKVLNENMPGVIELGREELKNVNGGFWWELAKWVALGILWDTFNDPESAAESFKNGLMAR